MVSIMKKIALILLSALIGSNSALYCQDTFVKVFGGTGFESGSSVVTTSDGEFILTGDMSSDDGDFEAMHKGKNDIFVLILEKNGSVRLSKVFGGRGVVQLGQLASGIDDGRSIRATQDGGFVLAGNTFSNDGDFNGMRRGNGDVFVFKLDKHCKIAWKKVFGGSEEDMVESMTTTLDDGIVLTGYTNSNDVTFGGMNKGRHDIYIIKLDHQGETQWKKVLGGSDEDYGNSIVTTPDGGFVVAGQTWSDDGDFAGLNKGGGDIVVIKLDKNGSILWKKVIGGDGMDEASSITVTPDGGYILTGFTLSNDGDFAELHRGARDITVVKLDKRGNIKWKVSIGGEGDDEGSCIASTYDGGFVLTGRTSSNDSDFVNMNHGGVDIIVVRLDKQGRIVWRKSFGGQGRDEGHFITAVSDGGFILTGVTESNDGDFKGMNHGRSDIFVIKLDKKGNLQPTEK
jgi:hypothetical protein